MMTSTMKKFFFALIRLHTFFFMMLLGLTLDNSIFAMQANEIYQSTHHQKIQQIIKEYFNNNQKNRLRGIAQLKKDLTTLLVDITNNAQNSDSFLEELEATFKSKNISHIFILILQSHQKVLPDKKEDTALKALNFLIENFPQNVLIVGSNDFLQFLCKSSEKEDFSLNETCKQKQKDLIALLGNKNTPLRPMQENKPQEPKILKQSQRQSPAKRAYNTPASQQTQKVIKISTYSTPFSSNNNNNNRTGFEIIEIDNSLTQESMLIENNTNQPQDINTNIFNDIIIDDENLNHRAIKGAVDNYFYSENTFNRFCPSIKEDLTKLLCLIADHYPFESQKEFVKKIENVFKYKVLQQILITILTSYKRIKPINKETIALKGLTFLQQVIPNKIVFVNKQNFNYFKTFLNKDSFIFSPQCQEKKDSILKALEQYESSEDQANNASFDYEIGKNSDSSQEYYKNDENSHNQTNNFENLDFLINNQSSPFTEMDNENCDETNYQIGHTSNQSNDQNNNNNTNANIIEVAASATQESMIIENNNNLSHDSNTNIFNDIIIDEQNPTHKSIKKAVDGYFNPNNKFNRFCPSVKEDLTKLLCFIADHYPLESQKEFVKKIENVLTYKVLLHILIIILTSYKRIKPINKETIALKGLTFLQQVIPNKIVFVNKQNFNYFKTFLNKDSFIFSPQCQEKKDSILKALEQYEGSEDQANNASSDYEIGKNSDSSQEYYKNDDNQINSDRQTDSFASLDSLIGGPSSPFIEMGYNNFDETNYQHINNTHFNQNNNSNWPQEPFYQDPKENDVIEQKVKKYFEECKKRNRKSRLNDYMQEDLINLLRTAVNYTYDHQKNAFTGIIKYLLELGSEIGSIISSMLSNQSNIKQESKKEYFSTILTFLEKAFPDNVTVRSGAPFKMMIKALNAKHFRFDEEYTERVKNLVEILQKY